MADSKAIAQAIRDGRTSLGIEFGSTRIKAVLIDDERNTITTGDYGWQSHLVDGLWSYDVDKIWRGLQSVYADVADRVEADYGLKLTRIGQIGFSAMMHGYLAFDADGELLVPFRTWQNTNTSEAHEKLSELFQYNIPERWSIAHLYQAVLDNEPHIGSVRYFTTLSGYVHWKLTGRKVLGIGDASGMFPIDPNTKTYEQGFIEQFDALPEVAAQPWKLNDLLPEPLVAGTPANSRRKARRCSTRLAYFSRERCSLLRKVMPEPAWWPRTRYAVVPATCLREPRSSPPLCLSTNSPSCAPKWTW